jgi:emfourin
MEVQRIRFERTGGFAGLRLAANFEADELSEDQFRALTELLDDLDFPELPENLSSDTSMSDDFTYTITVESRKWSHTVITSDAPDHEKMHELLEILNRLARKQQKKM